VHKYISYTVLLFSSLSNARKLSPNPLPKCLSLSSHLNYNIQVFYYTYSFSFLIARLAIVSLYGAWVSEESREPAFYLQSLPSATYNLEVTQHNKSSTPFNQNFQDSKSTPSDKLLRRCHHGKQDVPNLAKSSATCEYTFRHLQNIFLILFQVRHL
jgi:hypothetical protein